MRFRRHINKHTNKSKKTFSPNLRLGLRRMKKRSGFVIKSWKQLRVPSKICWNSYAQNFHRSHRCPFPFSLLKESKTRHDPPWYNPRMCHVVKVWHVYVTGWYRHAKWLPTSFPAGEDPGNEVGALPGSSQSAFALLSKIYHLLLV